MKTMRGVVLLSCVLLLLFSLSACSGDGEKEEKSSVQRFNEKNAQELVQQINAPMDKARGVQDVIDEKVKETEEAVEQAQE